MNHRMIRLLSFCLTAILLLAACQPKAQTLLPVTGKEDVALAAPAVMARDSVLQYLVSSSRLATLPPDTEWQLEIVEQPHREYQFRNGDWLMLVRLSNAPRANEQILLINPVEQISWSGYIGRDGHVVDTAYGR